MSSQKASLDLTHVLYNDSSWTSHALALVTLSPILLMASYAALAVQTREILIIIMWAGQLLSEGFNCVLKQIIKEERPNATLGEGYGFPSSHSQYMGYFASFLTCHLLYRHRFATTGYPILDVIWRLAVHGLLIGWASAVAYSRYHLEYHSSRQIGWGLSIGAVFGSTLYLFAEVVPKKWPYSLLGRFRTWLVANPISTWLQIRDGWAVWSDGGREEEWKRWKTGWDAQQTMNLKHD